MSTSTCVMCKATTSISLCVCGDTFCATCAAVDDHLSTSFVCTQCDKTLCKSYQYGSLCWHCHWRILVRTIRNLPSTSFVCTQCNKTLCKSYQYDPSCWHCHWQILVRTIRDLPPEFDTQNP